VARWTDQTGSFENLLAALGPTIPQNVSASMREWVTQHERITLRRRTSVLIFPTATARDAALSDGIAGRPIGERAILMNPHAPTGQVASSISYSQPPPPTLKVSETGQISIARNTPDLLTEPLLERWAERDGESWKLTAASIAAATKRNQRIEDLLRDLDQRLTQDMPPILRLALKNWANPQTTADLGRLTVLRLPDAETTDALLASKRFALLFAGRAGERILLVERAHLAKLRELLDWNGITIVEIDE
jgi:hypothetical protein